MSEKVMDKLPFPMLIGMSSMKARTPTHSGRKDGHAWWARDVWHIRWSGMTTVCGRDTSNYFNMGEMKRDEHLCKQCEKQAKKRGLL